MLRGAGAAGSDQRHRTQCAHPAQLFDIVADTGTVRRHAIEHDLTRAALLHFAHPRQRVALAVAAAGRVAGELIDPEALRRGLTVDTNHDALRSEALAELVDQLRVAQRR